MSWEVCVKCCSVLLQHSAVCKCYHAASKQTTACTLWPQCYNGLCVNDTGRNMFIKMKALMKESNIWVLRDKENSSWVVRHSLLLHSVQKTSLPLMMKPFWGRLAEHALHLKQYSCQDLSSNFTTFTPLPKPARREEKRDAKWPDVWPGLVNWRHLLVGEQLIFEHFAFVMGLFFLWIYPNSYGKTVSWLKGKKIKPFDVFEVLSFKWSPLSTLVNQLVIVLTENPIICSTVQQHNNLCN